MLYSDKLLYLSRLVGWAHIPVYTVILSCAWCENMNDCAHSGTLCLEKFFLIHAVSLRKPFPYAIADTLLFIRELIIA